MSNINKIPKCNKQLLINLESLTGTDRQTDILFYLDRVQRDISSSP